MDKKETIRKQMHELLDLVIDTNEFEKRNREKTGDMPTAFYEFSGHVNSLTVRIYNKGWMAYTDTDSSFDLDLEEPIPNEKMLAIKEAFINLPNKADALREKIEKAEKELAERELVLTALREQLKHEEGEEDV